MTTTSMLWRDSVSGLRKLKNISARNPQMNSQFFFCFANWCYLGVFKYDPDYVENEEKYKAIKAEILGEDDSDEESGSDESDEESEDEESREALQKKMEIQDKTNTNLVNLRKTIYLTIKSSLNFEECCHKLMLIQLEEGQQVCIHFLRLTLLHIILE